MKTRVAIDIDGVITANPSAMAWITYHLCKNENDFEVVILSWRNGGDDKRVQETERDLKAFGVSYHRIIYAPKKFDNVKTAGMWKMSVIDKEKIDIWIDDDLKTLKRDFGVMVDEILPEVIKIQI